MQVHIESVRTRDLMSPYKSSVFITWEQVRSVISHDATPELFVLLFFKFPTITLFTSVLFFIINETL